MRNICSDLEILFKFLIVEEMRGNNEIRYKY